MVLFTDGWGHTPRGTVRLSVFPPTPHTQPGKTLRDLCHECTGCLSPALGLGDNAAWKVPGLWGSSASAVWLLRPTCAGLRGSSCHLENMWPDNLRSVGSELWAPWASVWWTKALETRSGACGFGEGLALPTVGSQACLGEGLGLSAWGGPTLRPSPWEMGLQCGRTKARGRAGGMSPTAWPPRLLAAS